MNDDELLTDQLRYYEDRAPIYEQLYFRQGAYDLGPERNARWFAETAKLEASVAKLDLSGNVLELACGNGLWTRLIAPRAGHLTAVDASPTMLARNREWVADPRVRYVEADVFDWEPQVGGRFDVISLGFFISHVPPPRFERFWDKLRSWLEPDGVVWVADDCWAPDRPRSSERLAGEPEHAHLRRLGNSEYSIVKLFYRPAELTQKLGELGWVAELTSTGEEFLVGTAHPRL